ncbi:MAG TPA: sulfite exporter TauE/SafE family protein, partial [Actinomycetota bacterium]|nr:sulfite exporter TauE/SafE family protein [Actinomycetota bacterium]
MARADVRRNTAVAAVVGAAAGGLSGLFGVGGGILIVPGLVLIGGMGQRQAHATSLAAIVPIAVAGAIGYALEGAVDWPAAALLVLGAAAGTVAGTHLLGRISPRGLRILFAAFLLAAAAALPFEVAGTGVRVELDALDVTLLVAL